jgi:hypothetical protein
MYENTINGRCVLTRAHEGYRDSLLLELESRRIEEAVERMLGRGVG